MITRLLLATLLSLSVVPAGADDPAQANRLFVEAVKLIQAAEQEQPASQKLAKQKLAKLQSALAKLNQIMDDHPSSDVAVKLITEQEIGSLSLPKLMDAIQAATNRLAHEILIAADSREGVVRGLDEIADPAFRQKVLQEISSILRYSGVTLEDKLFFATSVEDARTRDDHLQSIALDQMSKENFQDALTAAELIRNDHKRDSVWKEIAEVHIRAGDLERALALAEGIKFESYRNDVWKAISEVYARAGNLERDLALAKRVKLGIDRDEVLHAIVRIQVNEDDFQGALAAAELMEESDWKAGILRQIEEEAYRHNGRLPQRQ